MFSMRHSIRHAWRLRVNIPKIREIVMIDGKWAIVTDFIEGKPSRR
jgi:hypothetical protein